MSFLTIGTHRRNTGSDLNGRRFGSSISNAPLVSSSIGVAPDPTASLLAPRPIAPNENIMQYQNYGHGRGAKYVLNLKQNSYKRFSLDATYWYLDFMDNSQTPQSTYSVRGESGRPNWMRRGGIAMLGTVTLPYKVDLSTQFSAMAWSALQHHHRHGRQTVTGLSTTGLPTLLLQVRASTARAMGCSREYGQWERPVQFGNHAGHSTPRHEPEPRLQPSPQR